MQNLKIYNAVRNVPHEAQRKIMGGRLKGKTDINPMWRIKTLTEQFGVCGFGWYTEIIDQWIEEGANNEVSAYVKINLFIKMDGEWSKPIVGIGGSMYLTKEEKGIYTDDECFKKAYTDAISVACKALGIGADIYWGEDATKYTREEKSTQAQAQSQVKKIPLKNRMLTTDYLKGINDWLVGIREKTLQQGQVFDVDAILDHYYTFEAGAKEVITKFYTENLNL